jgi:hypothetical protein
LERLVYPQLRKMEGGYLLSNYRVEYLAGATNKYFRLEQVGRERLEQYRVSRRALFASLGSLEKGPA